MPRASKGRRRIAGVTTGLLPDETPYHTGRPQFGFIDKLTRRYKRAQQLFVRQQFKTEERGAGDERVAPLEVRPERMAGPLYTFLLNEALLAAVTTAQSAQQSELTLEQLLHLGLAQTDGAVQPDFSADALNAINASYFASDIAFDKRAGLASMFAKNRPLNRALGRLLAAQSGTTGRTLRIKELCSGHDTAHWRDEAQAALDAGVQNVEVMLSDFMVPHIARAVQSKRVRVEAEQYSLFDPMPALTAAIRYNALIATYGFDSVWQPEDSTFVRCGGQWYRQLYRVKVADWSPRRDELIAALRARLPLPGARARDYDGIYIEVALEPYDLSQHPFAAFIEALEEPAVIFPGGMIKRAVEAFDRQLTEDGVFVTADTGNFGRGSSWTLPHFSGVAAIYKPEHYVVAKRILEEVYGLHATLMGLDDLARTYLAPGWERRATREEREELLHNTTNGIMVVTSR